MMKKSLRATAVCLIFCLSAAPAHASGLDGASMKWPWILPFAGILLSIAAGPSLFPSFWHAHYGKIALLWSISTVVPLAAVEGLGTATITLLDTALSEYLGFILLLLALYTTAGGLLLTGRLRPTTWNNTLILASGTLSASVIGTTGAAMVFIRPLITINEPRRHKAHLIVFFIVLVANVGGALTPIGDPPLLIGFLHGVEFFWPVRHLWLQTLIVTCVVLGLFIVVDFWYSRKERESSAAAIEAIRARGVLNLVLLALIISVIVGAAAWKTAPVLEFFGQQYGLQNLLRDAGLGLIALSSLWLTTDEHRARNGFSWEPMREVAILFACIFVAIVPVRAMLEAGPNGSFSFLLSAVTAQDGRPQEAAYFWLTGTLSAFLDNAPTYLVFFELAGGDAKQLMGPLAGTLASISMGAVYMGALTYIGNAPNLMVYAIAQERGIRMPDFFSYMFCAAAILVPVFILLTALPVPPILKLW